MDWIIPFIAILGAIGVLWALRDYFTSSKIIDERDPTTKQTDADREFIRTHDNFRNH